MVRVALHDPVRRPRAQDGHAAHLRGLAVCVAWGRKRERERERDSHTRTGNTPGDPKNGTCTCLVDQSCEPDLYLGQIIQVSLTGDVLGTVAQGIRNSVGMALHEPSGALLFTDNGRDNWNAPDHNNMPNDELNLVPQIKANRHNLADVGHYGFPFCYMVGWEQKADVEFTGGDESCPYTAALQPLGPHVAALGLAVYPDENSKFQASSFPAPYKGGVFVAQHGSWNRDTPVGHSVAFIGLEPGQQKASKLKSLDYSTFLTGFLNEANGDVWGRIADVTVMPDGSLLVSNDLQGQVYLVIYRDALAKVTLLIILVLLFALIGGMAFLASRFVAMTSPKHAHRTGYRPV